MLHVPKAQTRKSHIFLATHAMQLTALFWTANSTGNGSGADQSFFPPYLANFDLELRSRRRIPVRPSLVHSSSAPWLKGFQIGDKTTPHKCILVLVME